MLQGLKEILSLLACVAGMLPVRTRDRFTMRGDVCLTVRDAAGNAVSTEHKNLIVTMGKRRLVKILGGAYGAAAVGLTTIQVGSGTTPASPDQTALVSLLASYTIGTVTYPSDTSVQFSYTIPSTALNGESLNELGLVGPGDDPLFSRVVIGTINKTSAYTVQIDWLVSIQ